MEKYLGPIHHILQGLRVICYITGLNATLVFYKALISMFCLQSVAIETFRFLEFQSKTFHVWLTLTSVFLKTLPAVLGGFFFSPSDSHSQNSTELNISNRNCSSLRHQPLTDSSARDKSVGPIDRRLTDSFLDNRLICLMREKKRFQFLCREYRRCAAYIVSISSIHYFPCFVASWCCGGLLEAICRAHMVTSPLLGTSTHTPDSPIGLKMHVFEVWGETREPRKKHTVKEKPWILHTGRFLAWLGFKQARDPLAWGESSIYWDTTLLIISLITYFYDI